MDSIDPIITRDPAADVKQAMNRIFAKHGPLDASFSVNGNADDSNFGFETDAVQYKRSSSFASITDAYLATKEQEPVADSQDKVLEDEEAKLIFETVAVDPSKKKQAVDSKKLASTAPRGKQAPATASKMAPRKTSMSGAVHPGPAASKTLQKTVSPPSLPTTASMAQTPKVRKAAGKTDDSGLQSSVGQTDLKGDEPKKSSVVPLPKMQAKPQTHVKPASKVDSVPELPSKITSKARNV
jgi:hypothetical protein